METTASKLHQLSIEINQIIDNVITGMSVQA